MNEYQQQVLGLALVLAQKEFEEKQISESVLVEMDNWIERFGLQYGITWTITHHVQIPENSSRPILTFTASVYNPVAKTKAAHDPPSDLN